MNFSSYHPLVPHTMPLFASTFCMREWRRQCVLANHRMDIAAHFVLENFSLISFFTSFLFFLLISLIDFLSFSVSMRPDCLRFCAEEHIPFVLNGNALRKKKKAKKNSIYICNQHRAMNHCDLFRIYFFMDWMEFIKWAIVWCGIFSIFARAAIPAKRERTKLHYVLLGYWIKPEGGEKQMHVNCIATICPPMI